MTPRYCQHTKRMTAAMSTETTTSEVRSYRRILLAAMIGTGCGLLSITQAVRQAVGDFDSPSKQARGERLERGRRPGGAVELAKDALDMSAYGAGADTQRAGGFLVARAEADLP